MASYQPHYIHIRQPHQGAPLPHRCHPQFGPKFTHNLTERWPTAKREESDCNLITEYDRCSKKHNDKLMIKVSFPSWDTILYSYMLVFSARASMAPICRSWPCSLLWQHATSGDSGSFSTKCRTVARYSLGGIIATRALDDITRTPKTGLAARRKSGGRNSDRALKKTQKRHQTNKKPVNINHY